MKFARWVFWIAGVYGLIVLTPHYFMEDELAKHHPPAITHPEFFYGFIGVGIAWQIAFLMIGGNPARFRPMMLAGIVEKFSFAAATTVLFLNDRLIAPMFAAGLIDGSLGILFLIAWWRLRSPAPAAQ